MKISKVLAALILLATTTSSLLYADNLQSPNYKIIDATTNGGGEVTKSNTGDYNLLNSVGGFAGDPRLESANYRAGLGAVEIFTANVPLISCFETTTDGSSACTSGPSYLNEDGMTSVCGPSGCYNKARFEIDAQRNPTDTLYAIQISEDNFASDIKYIDGVAYKAISPDNVSLTDFRTKAQWETPIFNITGLETSKQYWIRAVALHGDFTESEPGTAVTATTAAATMQFDIDIEDKNGVSSNTEPPFNIQFSDSRKIIKTGPAQTAEDLIWMDVQTNAQAGFAVVHKGLNGGLNSASQNNTIPSDSVDLDEVIEGFGLQRFYSAQQRNTGSGDGDLGSIGVAPGYGNSGNSVGQIDQVFSLLCNSGKPVLGGRIAFYLKARAAGTTPAADDYTEEITFIMIPRY